MEELDYLEEFNTSLFFFFFGPFCNPKHQNMFKIPWSGLQRDILSETLYYKWS